MLEHSLSFRIYKECNPNELTPAQLQALEEEISTPADTQGSDELWDFLLWCRKLPSRQERFAQFLSKKLPKTEGLRVLEVGCGRTARLSRFLCAYGFHMTAIDPKLELNYCNNFIGIRDVFDYEKFDLTDYDFVVAQEPCDATEHIVRACINQNKPFMITLCGVPHQLISGETPANVYDWHNYLVNIAKNQLKLRYIELDPISKTPLLKSNQF